VLLPGERWLHFSPEEETRVQKICAMRLELEHKRKSNGGNNFLKSSFALTPATVLQII
jgi:hypothetical protein